MACLPAARAPTISPGRAACSSCQRHSLGPRITAAPTQPDSSHPHTRALAAARSHGDHRDIPARRLAALSTGGNQARHIMTRTSSPRHSIAPLPRRVLIGRDHARRRDAQGNRLVDQSPLRDASSGDRNRPTVFATSSTAPYRGGNRSSATHRQRRNPHSI